MSLKRKAELSRATAPGAHLSKQSMMASMLLAAGAACSAYPTIKASPLDCTAVQDKYDFQTIDNFEMVGAAQVWTSSDSVDASISTAVQAIPEGGPCGGMGALVLRSAHANDWGSLFGFNNFGPRDESAYEGLSFFARAPGNTSKSFTLLLDDPNTSDPTRSCTTDAGPPPSPDDAGTGSNCKLYCGADGGMTGGSNMTIYDPATGMAVSGGSSAQPPPDACGNGYTAVVVVTTDWRFYTVPFNRFQQNATPNRVPNAALTKTGTAPGTALLTNSLLNMIIRMPKESTAEFWFDNLSFYRKKAAGAVGDGGTQ